VAARTTELRLAEDVGRAAAVNRAVAGLDAEVGWMAITDAHVTWHAGAVDALRSAALRHPRAGVLGPLLRTTDGTAIASAGALPRLRDLVRGRLDPAVVTAGPVGWLSGACLLVRRAAWDSVDGYDPRYAGSGHDPELADVDLGDRLARAGWLAVGVPAAEAAVHPYEGQGILDTYDRGLRRFVRDRYPAPSRGLLRQASSG
jgi:N-acetylglucosaminyl-diphospho-decaprenol L-rhamnosyltransferase